MANPYAVNVATEVVEIIAGLQFGFEFDIGLDESSPAEDLTDYISAEFKIGQDDAAIIWSITSGHIVIEDNIFKLSVPAEETATLFAATLVHGRNAWRTVAQTRPTSCPEQHGSIAVHRPAARFAGGGKP